MSKENGFSDSLVDKMFYLFCVLFVLGLLFNYIFGETWNNLLSNEPVQYRYGFIRPAGYFAHYAPNGYFFSLCLITLFMLSTKTIVIDKLKQIRKFFLLVIIDFLSAFPLTVRKGLFMIIPYGSYIISLLDSSRRYLFVMIAVLFITAFLVLVSGTEMFSDTLSNINNLFSDDHSYLRGLIVFYGFVLFADFFPFGVGNGLYGTYFSNHNYSVYEYVGLNPVIFIRDNGALSGVYDSGISAFIAESGFSGLVLIFTLIYLFFAFNRKNLDAYSYKVFKILTYFSLLLSITEPVWQNGFYTTFYIICILYVYTKNNKHKVNGSWVYVDKNEDVL